MWFPELVRLFQQLPLCRPLTADLLTQKLGSITHPSLSAFSSQGLATRWLSGIEQDCYPEIQSILLNSRKPTMRKSFLLTWKRFQVWCSHWPIHPFRSHVAHIFDYLLNLIITQLLLTEVRFTWLPSQLFTPLSPCWGIFSLYLPYHLFRTALSDLNLVLNALRNLPFEPMGSCSFLHLLLKIS